MSTRDSYRKGSNVMNVMDVVKDIVNLSEEEVKNMDPINIMLIGKTGVGKSTLINNIFRENLAETGIGRPITKHLEKISKDGIPINLYDTRGLELDQKVQREVRDEVDQEIFNMSTHGAKEDQVHLIWYCINAGGKRLESFEEEWIKDLSGKLPVVIVLTQSLDQEAAEVFKGYIEGLDLDIRGVITLIASPFKIGGHIIPSYGLPELVGLTIKIIPENAERAFINAQKVDIMMKADYAKKWAKGFIAETFMVGFTPIPFADAPILASSQVAMIAKITSIFGVSVNKAFITSVVSSAAGVSGAVYTGRMLVSNLFKLVPGAGTIVGGLISGGTAALITTALAYAYINVMVKVSSYEYLDKRIEQSEIVDLMRNELKKQISTLKKEKKDKTDTLEK